MPTKRKPLARFAREGLDAAVKAWLLTGEESPGLDVLSVVYGQAGRQLWEEHRDVLLAEWTAEHPGTRPHGWFEYELPRGSPGRLKVGGSGQESAVWHHSEARWAYYDVDTENPPQIESMATFLRRLELLLPGEEARVPKGAWKPEVLDVDPEAWAPAGTGGWSPEDESAA